MTEPRDTTGDTPASHIRNAQQLVRLTRADIDAVLAAIDARLVAALQLLEQRPSHPTKPEER